MTDPRIGVRVFDSDRAQSDRPGTLLEAYELLPSPKPSLGTVVRLASKGELSVDTSRPVMTVESVNFFREELQDWMARTGYMPPRSGLSMPSVPPGFVLISQFVRQHISLADGKRVGLFTNSEKNERSQLSDHVKHLLRSGDVPSATTITGRNYWAARQSDVEEWLWRRWGLEIKR